MNFRYIFLPSLLLFSGLAAFPSLDDVFDFFNFGESAVQYEPYAEPVFINPSVPASSDCWKGQDAPIYSPSILQGYTRPIKLKGITGARKKLPGFYHHESHAYVPNKKNWKCGLHMLYNMCEVERALGMNDIIDEEFINECERNPELLLKKGSFPKDLKKAARKTSCSPLYIIEHNDLSGYIDIVCGSQNEKTFWRTIHNHLNKSGPQCVHFGCLICIEKEDDDEEDKENDENENEDDEVVELSINGKPVEWHIFLISVVKLADESKSVYLLDNMNRDVGRPAQKLMLRHVEYIYGNIFG